MNWVSDTYKFGHFRHFIPDFPSHLGVTLFVWALLIADPNRSILVKEAWAGTAF